MLVEMQNSSGGGGSGALRKLGSLEATPTSYTVVRFNLSGVVNANAELYTDFIPVLPNFRGRSASSSNVSLVFNWTYDKSTQILTCTLTNGTSYIMFSTAGTQLVDIYGIG